MTIVSMPEYNLFNDLPCVGIHDIVADDTDRPVTAFTI